MLKTPPPNKTSDRGVGSSETSSASSEAKISRSPVTASLAGQIMLALAFARVETHLGVFSGNFLDLSLDRGEESLALLFG